MKNLYSRLMQLLLGISLIAAVAGCEKDDNTSDDIEGGGRPRWA